MDIIMSALTIIERLFEGTATIQIGVGENKIHKIDSVRCLIVRTGTIDSGTSYQFLFQDEYGSYNYLKDRPGKGFAGVKLFVNSKIIEINKKFFTVDDVLYQLPLSTEDNFHFSLDGTFPLECILYSSELLNKYRFSYIHNSHNN